MIKTACLPVVLAILAAVGLEQAAAQPLANTRSWGYQLQNNSPDAIAQSPFDLVVIDYSRDGSAGGEFSTTEIAQIRASGKSVVSYLSIGEAEDYRYYFDPSWVKRKRRGTCGVQLTAQAPAWLDAPNRDWCGNYKVRYWDPAWQAIVFGNATDNQKSYLDRIIDAGFDGVYLDIIDGFEYWQAKRGKAKRRTAAADMASFVVALTQYARDVRGKTDFIVIPQNGLSLVDEIEEPLRSAYLASISAVAAEDVFYFGNRAENNRYKPQKEALQYLRLYRDLGKPVFVIDYLTKAGLIANFQQLSCGQGFIPQVSTRELETLGANRLVGCGN